VKTKKATTKDVEAWATGHQAGPTIPGPANHKVTSPTKESQEDAKRKRFTVNMTPDLIEWARRAVVFTPGQSLCGLVEEALTRELQRLEKLRKEPFPHTTASPKKGRPIVLKG